MPYGIFSGFFNPPPPLDYSFVEPRCPGRCHCRREKIDFGRVSQRGGDECRSALRRNLDYAKDRYCRRIENLRTSTQAQREVIQYNFFRLDLEEEHEHLEDLEDEERDLDARLHNMQEAFVRVYRSHEDFDRPRRR